MYERTFGLTERAFEPDPDARFHFPSLSNRRAMSSIGFGLNRGAGIIAITGDRGIGKTQLVLHVLSQVNREEAVIAMLTLTGTEDRSLIEQVAMAFGLPDPGTVTAAREGISQFLASERDEGRAALLLIDEAHNLDGEGAGDLAFLAGLTRGQRGLLQIMIAGQPSLAERFDSGGAWKGVRGRVVAEHRLEPLLADEVDPYIYHRLTVAGRSASPKMDAGLAALVFEATGGIPATINSVMTTLLEQAAQDGREVISGDPLASIVDEPEEDPDMVGHAARTAPEPGERKQEPTRPPVEPLPPPPAGQTLSEVQLSQIEKAFAEQESSIAGLKRDLAQMRAEPAENPGIQAIESRLSALESRLDQQEQALKHMLGKLIDFFEGSDPDDDY